MSPGKNIVLKCRVPLPFFSLDIDVAFRSRVTSIFGSSGAGKTSLLDVIAGLRVITSGEIEIDGRVLFSTSRGINLSPQKRGIGYVPQEAALFPHLSVKGNILFGSKREGGAGNAALIGLDHVAEILEIAHLLDRPVAFLSGGECQRVAFARSILSRPQLLLLDEPLASLDVALKERIIPYLRRVRDEFGIPMIYVTHDPMEVLALADWAILLRKGRLLAQGVPREVLMSGLALSQSGEETVEVENVLNGYLMDSNRSLGWSRVRLESGQKLFIPYTSGELEKFLQIRIRGDEILAATHRPEGISAGNVLRGRITRIEFVDGLSVLRVDAGDIFFVRLTQSAVDRLELEEEKEIFLIIKVRSCVVL